MTANVIGSPSGSLSLPITLKCTGVLSGVAIWSSPGVGGEFGPFHDNENAPAAVYPKLLSWLPVPPDENTATRYSDVEDTCRLAVPPEPPAECRDAISADGERRGRIGRVEHGDTDAGEGVTIVEQRARVMRDRGEVHRTVASAPAVPHCRLRARKRCGRAPGDGRGARRSVDAADATAECFGTRDRGIGRLLGER